MPNQETLHHCKSCANSFIGKYCNLCGEKIVEDKDFTLTNIFFQAIGAVTKIDSKFYQTSKALLFQPGLLSKKHVEGERTKYMKPFQIFFLSNILFFIFLSDIDVFRTPSKWYFAQDFDGVQVLKKVNEIAEVQKRPISEIALLYDQKSSQLAKGFILLLVPLISFIAMLLHLKNRMPYGKHFIFSIHYFSFLLLLFVFWLEFTRLLRATSIIVITNNLIPLAILMAIYYILAIKQFYQNTWPKAVFKGIIGVFLINVLIQLYRAGVSFITLNMI